jgi:transposase
MSIPRPMRCSRTRGKKGYRHRDPDDPPRRRANKRRGHGSYENDRPPIVGSVGRETGEVRLRVERCTDRKTLLGHVHGYAAIEATLYTDEWRAYEKVEREHRTVSHGVREWARDDDGDGIREVHVNTISRGCGRACATSYGRSEGYTRSIWEAMWRCASSLSTSNALVPLSSPHSSPCTLCKHEPRSYGGNLVSGNSIHRKPSFREDPFSASR